MQEQIALLFGIPLTEGEFLERASDPRWDYGRRLIANRSASETFERIYATVCNVAAKLLEVSQHFGATTYRRTTLADLESASLENDVLILVAHWRGSFVEADDLLPGWLDCLQAAPKGGLLHELASLLLRPDLPLAKAIERCPKEDPELRILAADTLNRLITSNYFVKWLPAGIGVDLATSQKVLEALSRDLVDGMFSGRIRAGNQLELWDGLHGPAAIDAALYSEFFGTLDLSCCTASVLGTYLSTSRNACFDVIMGDPLIVPSPQLQLIQGVLETIAQVPDLRYELARRTIAQALAKWRPPCASAGKIPR